MPNSPWYEEGLRFECTQCGNCCTGSSGAVRVSDTEIEVLASRQDMRPDEFRTVYTRTLRGGDISLREKRNGDCVFFARGKGCSVYEDRPRQCRAWPFWRPVVASRERWDEEALDCPGMNDGPLISASEIDTLLEEDATPRTNSVAGGSPRSVASDQEHGD
jgi:Fe-S-cluster containining protein